MLTFSLNYIEIGDRVTDIKSTSFSGGNDTPRSQGGQTDILAWQSCHYRNWRYTFLSQ